MSIALSNRLLERWAQSMVSAKWAADKHASSRRKSWQLAILCALPLPYRLEQFQMLDMVC